MKQPEPSDVPIFPSCESCQNDLTLGEFAGLVGMGGEDADVAEAGGGEPRADGVERQVQLVAFAAEMGQEDLPEGVAGDFGEEGGGGFVGKVALASEDSLFERPGAM